MLLKSALTINNTLVKINITSSSNNTIICILNFQNEVLFCGSSGFLNIKGAKRSTSYASQRIATILGKKLYFLGFKYVYIIVKGFGNGRYSSIKGFSLAGLIILNVFDKTSLPFNGCRAPKKRRI